MKINIKNKTFKLVLALFLGWGLLACNDANNAVKDIGIVETLDEAGHIKDFVWSGIYEGLFPCADCEGIEVSIELNDDFTYIKKEHYIKDDADGYFEDKGKFEWRSEEDIIVLESDDGDRSQYQLGEHQLIALKDDGTPVVGSLENDYILWKH